MVQVGFDHGDRASELHPHLCNLVLVQVQVELQEVVLEELPREGLHATLAEVYVRFPEHAAVRLGQVHLYSLDELLLLGSLVLIRQHLHQASGCSFPHLCIALFDVVKDAWCECIVEFWEVE